MTKSTRFETTHSRWFDVIAPARMVMNRLRFPFKFALICLLFVFPLSIVMYLFITEINDKIEFTKKEMKGNQCFRPIHSLLGHTLQARFATQTIRSGKTSGRDNFVALIDQIDSDIHALESVERELGTETLTGEKMSSLMSHWQRLKTMKIDQERVGAEGLLVEMINDIDTLIAQIGDSSNLVLDISLDTYYPINVLLLRLPEIEKQLAQIQLLGQSVLASNSLEDDRNQFIRIEAVIRSNLKQIQNGMRVAFLNNPPHNLQEKLEAALGEFTREVPHFLDTASKEFHQPRPMTVDDATFENGPDLAMRASIHLWDLAINEVDDLLQSRINRFCRQKYLIVVVSLLSMLLNAYLLTGFYGSVMRTVSSLERASQRMVDGGYSDQILLETQDEMAQVVASFNTIAEQLRTERDHTFEVNAELEAFAYSVSHDLRAPLRAMQGITQALLEDYGSQMDDTAQNYAQRIVNAAAEMENLIQDLLGYSRLSRAEIHLSPTKLKHAITKAQAQLANVLQEHQAQILMDDLDFTVLAHSATLVQVIANLLSNAVKFVASGVRPQVNLSVQRSEGRIRLCVSDNGIGIAPEHQERIFRVFERLHGVEAYPGSGIGLAIVRKGVTRMGGRCGVSSQIGQGSQFWVELLEGTENCHEP